MSALAMLVVVAAYARPVYTSESNHVTMTNVQTGEQWELYATATYRGPLWPRPVYAVAPVRVWRDPATKERQVWVDPCLDGVPVVRLRGGARTVERFDVDEERRAVVECVCQESFTSQPNSSIGSESAPAPWALVDSLGGKSRTQGAGAFCLWETLRR